MSNYLKVLRLICIRTENKLKEIIPHPQRTRRGLINGLGSIFKAVSGNLDASDGERYDNLITQLQKNQDKLSTSIVTQNSICFDIINKFNKTIMEINHNEKVLDSKIDQLSLIINHSEYDRNITFIKDTLIQMINLYEVIQSVLQDVENAITFAKLKVMHPSIITVIDLFRSLKQLTKQVNVNQLPMELTLENTLFFEKLIEVECYISNNRVTYLIHIPITYPYQFEYFHLYSIPILSKNRLKTVISKDKYLIKNEMYFGFKNQPCKRMFPQLYICKKLNLEQFTEESPCELQLLNGKRANNCRETEIKIAELIVKQLDNTNQWIWVIPIPQFLKLECNYQDETIRMHGTYLSEIPMGCKISFNNRTIINNVQTTNGTKSILFPELEETLDPTLPYLNLTLHIKDIGLDELHELKSRIIANNPLIEHGITRLPNAWTIIIYVIVILFIVCLIYRKIRKHQKSKSQVIDSNNIQLPSL